MMNGCSATAEDQRVFARLLEHLVELVDDHLGELPAGVVADRPAPASR